MKNSRINLQLKKAFRTLFILSLLIVNTNCIGNDQNRLKRYEVKSAVVHYRSTVSGIVMGSTISGSGTESLYFKNWGAVELVEEESTQTNEVNVFGTKKTETVDLHTINKMDNGENYHVDFYRKTITHSRNAAMDLMQQTNTDAAEASKNMLESMGGKKIGDEKILGYTCEIWELLGAKQWMHKGVVLKLEATSMGIKTIKEATGAEFNISIADKYFNLPDFPIQEVEGFVNNEEYDDEMDEMDEKMEILSKMTYSEWKSKFVPNDDRLKTMSEDELHQTFDMIQKMIKMRKER